MKNEVRNHAMLNIKQVPITCLFSAALIATVNSGCAGNGKIEKIQSFDTGWRFYAGEINDAEKPEYNDASWLSVNVPHDWSIEGHSRFQTKKEDAPEFNIVKGEWKFSKGDNLHWKVPDTDESSWQIVKLPSTWEEHSNYTPDNVYGWYRRELTIPADLNGKDIFINLGKIDDADETYFNGVKVGSMGSFPPNYTSAWDIFRYYKVPHEIIHYGAKNSIAVRVFDGIMGGGIYNEGEKITEGPFESTCPGGSGAGYINAGTGWYRKAFKLPENIQSKRVFIEFDGVYMNSDVWINGVHLGNRPYGYSSFQYELTQHLNFGDKIYDAIEKFINLRYRLLPYIYATSWDVTANQSTMMRALVMDFSKDKQALNINDQYMFGKSLLVCPVTTPMYSRDNKEDFSTIKTRQLYLPKGADWFDFWTGEKNIGGQTIVKETPIDIMPLYVKAGSILPFGPKVQYATEKKWDNLQIRVYEGADGEFTLYEDENDNYNYENGIYSTITFSWDDAEQTLTISERKGSFPGMLEERKFNIIKISKGKGAGDGVVEEFDKVITYTGQKTSVKL
jgi:hypothetical protein